MKSMARVLLLALCIILSLAAQNYTLFKEIDLPNNQQKVAFSDDFRYAFLYDNSINSVTSYRAYDWGDTLNPKQFQLNTKPNSLQFCYDAQFQNSFVFADSTGVVYKGGIQKGGQAYLLMENLKINVKKVYPSFDSTLFAAFEQNGSKVYISDLRTASTDITVLDYEQNQINSIRWVPGKLQLAIVGGNISKNTSVFEIYDVDQRIAFNYTRLATQILADIEFSSDGTKIYGLYASPFSNDILIPIFDIASANITGNLSAFTANSLLQLRRSGNFLTAFNSNNAYVWNLINEQFYGAYPSILKSAGLSVDGSDLVTMTSQSKIQIFKLCRNLQNYFDSQKNICSSCKSPCLNCFSQEDKCSSCVSNYFLNMQFKCNACLDNCQTCQNETYCDKCLEGFFYETNQCISCSQSIVGCLSCSNRDNCLKCDKKNNWKQSFDFKCNCTSGYLQVDKVCLACPLHCDTCSDVNTCLRCNLSQHRAQFPNSQGKCVCTNGYYEQNDVCSSCILGCATCTNSRTCERCDADHYWQLQEGKCVCPADRTQSYGMCLSCSYLLNGCLKCNSQISCTECIQGYTLNAETNQCEVSAGANVIIIVIVIIAAVAAVGIGAYFLWIMLKKRRARQVQTLLQSQGAQQYERVQN